MIKQLIFEKHPDVYHPDVMIMLMFPEHYETTENQRVYLKSTAKLVSTEQVARAFKLAIGLQEDALERPLTDDERYRFVSELWRRFNMLLHECYIEIENPKAMHRMLMDWLQYEHSLMG